MEQLPKIAEFYKGQTLFLTGFSGFLGQLLVEKILRSCPDVECIYVLIRGKRTLDYKARTDSILNSRAFAVLREQNKQCLMKVIPLDGDLIEPGLGLTCEQGSELCRNVTMVFHCAASVSFDDPLPRALDINVRGTKTMLELAVQMPKLITFIHVSTAYSNSNRHDIEEIIYPSVADWRKTLEIRDKLDETCFTILSNKYMDHMANSYVFAKSLAEQVVEDYSHRLPATVIFRPSIVTAVLEEPVVGWVENLNGPNALSIGVGTGVVRSVYVKEDVRPDFMPVDLAIKGLVVAACASSVDKDRLKVYNWCSNDLSIKYSEYNDIGMRAIRKVPLTVMLWHPNAVVTSNYFWFYLNFVLFQLVPAFFLDLLIRLAGKPPLLWKIQKKIHKTMTSLSFFLFNGFNFHNQSLFTLEKRIRPDDRETFEYVKRPEGQELVDYFNSCARYQGKWFFKMTEADFTRAKRLRNIMCTIDTVLKTCFYIYVGWKVYTINLIPSTLNSIQNFIVNF